MPNPILHSELTNLIMGSMQEPVEALKSYLEAVVSRTAGGVLAEEAEIPEGMETTTRANADAAITGRVTSLGAIAAPPINMKREIPWGATVSQEFVDSVLWIESQIGLSAECLMPCMKFESNLNPQAKNPQSSATGLIQFMEATAQRLGTTTAKLYAMSAVTQLSYVYKYFKDYADRGHQLSKWDVMDTYMAILWPAGIGKDPDYRVFTGGSSAYKVNAGLDLNKDGFVTKREACQRVINLAAEGLKNGNVKVI
jgi:hypothetical protein